MTRAVVQVLKLVFDGPNFVLISIFYALNALRWISTYEPLHALTLT